MPDEKQKETKYTVSLPADPRQRDIEQFQAARRKYAPPFEPLTGVEYNGAFVRAAADLGWIEGLTADDVGNMRAAVVAQLATPINEWMPGE
jgi:hypothetical protein